MEFSAINRMIVEETREFEILTCEPGPGRWF